MRLRTISGLLVRFTVVVRRLPVVQSDVPAAEGSRTPWQWFFVALGATLFLWFPLAVAGAWAGPRLAHAVAGTENLSALAEELAGASAPRRVALALVQVAPMLIGFGLAALGSGALVGRLAKNAGLREALGGSLAAVLLLLVVAGLGGALGPAAVVLAAGAALGLAGALGAWAGVTLARRKSRKRLPLSAG